MARSASACSVWVCLVVMTALARGAIAKNYVVGGDHGFWYLRPGNPTFYQDWANRNGPYHVLDSLEFFFMLDESVAQVNEHGFNVCDLRLAYAFWSEGGHVFFPLLETKRYYFTSGSGHCPAGQKFYVDVVDD